MGQPSMEAYLTGRTPDSGQPPTGDQQGGGGSGGGGGSKGPFPEWLQTTFLIILILAVAFLLYDGYQFQVKTTAEIAELVEHIEVLESVDQEGAQKMTSLAGELSETKKSVGSTRNELRSTTRSIKEESQKAQEELSLAIAEKADAQYLEAVKRDADKKISDVNSEVGTVKNAIGGVQTDLQGTQKDLGDTQRQLLDVKETLSAAVAKNADELVALRLKGERDYFEFEIPKKNRLVKVADIRLKLKKTDHKKSKFNIEIIVDDSKLEKKNRFINEPIQFLVGRDRARYELVVNWVQKNRIGGYVSVPKVRGSSAERASTN